ncbi:MAG: LPS export ABC transporter periplasmic protein LptC [Gammaproteobacteria bacterium]|nr:MAG: LPS export ABC transporter periplasmic protein LptC [Gammaproteobacteria bacterium]RLA53599.1 MAG: LPS export ABC transporter periplasmic protein LptC [Gammaproteobacteria bacterium]
MKNTLMAVVIAVALGIFVVFWDSAPGVFLSKEKTPAATLSRADSYMINSETHKFNEQGVETFILNTQRGQFFKSENKFVMDKPNLQANGDTPQAPPWVLNAEVGVVFNQGEKIVMQRNVHAQQEIPAGTREFNTSELTYYPDLNVAESDRHVTLTSPGEVTTGIGMKADFEQEVFQLMSTVKSTRHAAY